MSDTALTTGMGGSILCPDTDTLGTVTDSGHVADTISEINYLLSTLLAAQDLSLSALEMVNLPEPDSQTLIFVDEGGNDLGYDSDGQIGPLFGTIYYEDPLHAVNE